MKHERKMKMKTIKTKVYEFNELNDSAKEKARNWFRDCALDYEWWDSTYDDAKTIGLKITGFDLDRNRHADGEFNCFGGAEQCAGLILKEHGATCETFKTATTFIADLAKLNAEIEAVDGDDETNCEYETWQDKRGLLGDEFLRSLLEDYSIMLQHEYEYLLGDEAVDESITANEYTFTVDGKRF
jgi:hypothetical protein